MNSRRGTPRGALHPSLITGSFGTRAHTSPPPHIPTPREERRKGDASLCQQIPQALPTTLSLRNASEPHSFFFKGEKKTTPHFHHSCSPQALIVHAHGRRGPDTPPKSGSCPGVSLRRAAFPFGTYLFRGRGLSQRDEGGGLGWKGGATYPPCSCKPPRPVPGATFNCKGTKKRGLRERTAGLRPLGPGAFPGVPGRVSNRASEPEREGSESDTNGCPRLHQGGKPGRQAGERA